MFCNTTATNANATVKDVLEMMKTIIKGQRNQSDSPDFEKRPFQEI